jgi:hypothetical protein
MKMLAIGWPMVVLFATGGVADELNNINSKIVAYNRNHICPPQEEYPILKFSEYCKSLCDKGWTCNGSPQTDPCYTGDREACRKFAEETSACLSDMNAKNATIIQYNAIVRNCHRQASQSSSSAHNQKGLSGNALASAVREAKAKAEEARAKALDMLAKDAQKRKDAEIEKTRIKEAVNQASSDCEKAIRACQQRAISLSDLRSTTRSQCKAYCQLLQIESCNPRSTTIAQAAGSCQAGAEHDQKDAADARQVAESRAVAKDRAECFQQADMCDDLCEGAYKKILRSMGQAWATKNNSECTPECIVIRRACDAGLSASEASRRGRHSRRYYQDKARDEMIESDQADAVANPPIYNQPPPRYPLPATRPSFLTPMPPPSTFPSGGGSRRSCTDTTGRTCAVH